MQQGDQHLGVGLGGGLDAVVGQDHDVVPGAGVLLVEDAAVADVAGAVLEGEGGEVGRELGERGAGGGVGADDAEGRARGHVGRDAADDRRDAGVPAEHEGADRLAGRGRGGDDEAGVDAGGPRVGGAAVVVGGDEDEALAGGDDAVHGRHELDAAVAAAQAHEGAVLELMHGAGEGLSDHGGGVGEVDLVAGEAEQLLVDQRQPGLQAGLDGDLGDQVADLEDLDAALAGELGDGDVAGVADLGDHVLAAAGLGGGAADGEQGPHDLGVVAGALGGEHDDRAGALGGDELEGAGVGGVAGADDDAGAAGAAQLGAQLVLHPQLVVLGVDDDAAAPVRLVGGGELADDGEDLARPAEHEGVVLLEHAGVAAAQVVEALGDAGDQDGDEAADQEDAADRRGHHEGLPGVGALVAGDRAGVDRVHQHGPQQGGEADRCAVLAGRDLADGDDQQRDREHRGEGHQQVPEDQGPGAARHQGVEGVVEAVAEGGPGGHAGGA